MKSLAKECLSEGKKSNYSADWLDKWDKELKYLGNAELVKFKKYCECLYAFMIGFKTSSETQKQINILDGRD